MTRKSKHQIRNHEACVGATKAGARKRKRPVKIRNEKGEEQSEDEATRASKGKQADRVDGSSIASPATLKHKRRRRLVRRYGQDQVGTQGEQDRGEQEQAPVVDHTKEDTRETEQSLPITLGEQDTSKEERTQPVNTTRLRSSQTSAYAVLTRSPVHNPLSRTESPLNPSMKADIPFATASANREKQLTSCGHTSLDLLEKSPSLFAIMIILPPPTESLHGWDLEDDLETLHD
ncbi:hypothetical protein BKA64DRAFT_640190 [Cadophora sp. MPI-SDFR-AT-0126]|nr:hypothetical protein BKA64DRAFT_640190 [Leotiomycetes sp. MPI-SDFR-AT-0126]